MIRGIEDIEAAFATSAMQQSHAVIAQPSLPRKPIIELALRHRLPTASPNALFCQEGGLLSYAPNSEVIWKRSAT